MAKLKQATVPTVPQSWHVVLIFPNLSSVKSEAFSAEGIRICAVGEIEDSIERNAANDTIRQLVKRFQTVFAERYEPSVLAVSASDTRLLEREVLSDFRNACSISAVSGGRAAKLGDRGQWHIRYSDFFLFNHHVAGKDGSIISLGEGISRGMDDEVDAYTGSSDASIRNPANFSAEVDKPLLNLLSKHWRRRHFSKRVFRADRQLFRALRIAFQASRYPSDGFGTHYDVGTRIGLWVSAFETLFHPGKGNVDKTHVQIGLREARWTDKEFTLLKYSAWQRRKRSRVTLPEKLYDQLYSARNDFMHGNRLRIRSKVWRFKSKSFLLEFVAPCLFAAAIRARLRYRATEPDDVLSDEHFWGLGRIQRAIKLKGV